MSFPVDNIRVACAVRNTTLAELERKLKIGNGVIARWEHSKKSPPYDRLLAIANELGTTVDALSAPDIPAMELTVRILQSKIDNEKEKTAAPKGDGEQAEWVKAWAEASPEQRALALSVLRLGSQQHEDQGKHSP